MADEGISLQFGGRSYPDPKSGMDAIVATIRNTWNAEAGTVAKALFAYLTEVADILAQRNSGSWPGGTTSSSIASRSGESVASILKSVNVEGTTWDRLQGSIGGRSTLWIHEYGGTISSSKLLTIPLPAALSSRGVPLKSSAADWSNTFVARSKAGNLIIFQRQGLGVIVPLYVLKDSVHIPARLGMRQELQNQVPYFLSQASDMVVRDFLQQLG